MRLNRYLALCGLGSRRACDQLIEQGQVEINGQVILSMGVQVEPDDKVFVGGKAVNAARSTTLVLHKPAGVQSTRKDEKGRPTVYDLLPPHLRHLHYVGRLDAPSEGLLVFTNEGELTQQLTHPSHKVEKEYLVSLNKACRKEMVEKLLKGIELEEGLAKAVAVHSLSPRRLSMVLQQGMNRQIRRMFDALDCTVERLVRIRIGMLTLEGLNPGKWKLLKPEEIRQLTSEWQPPKRERRRIGEL